MKIEKLVKRAIKAKEKAYAPYSNFKVGAVLFGKDGQIFFGCNVENASYGLSMCAERVALFKAVSEGYKDFELLVLVSDSNEFCPPCGACRQVLWEFSRDLKIVMLNQKGDTKEINLKELLPHAFTSFQKGDAATFGSKGY